MALAKHRTPNCYPWKHGFLIHGFFILMHELILNFILIFLSLFLRTFLRIYDCSEDNSSLCHFLFTFQTIFNRSQKVILNSKPQHRYGLCSHSVVTVHLGLKWIFSNNNLKARLILGPSCYWKWEGNKERKVKFIARFISLQKLRFHYTLLWAAYSGHCLICVLFLWMTLVQVSWGQLPEASHPLLCQLFCEPL